ncbi:zf-HC2 domain-containing protein [Radiobacillus deserti]|uniref:Zf-HC2 domain-containing protein n=1 Tax=Radiobacillus deserti TaxID=2594883 RepID=A0A516KD43_9BACI|nr:zf-HC2 domain-containing protein [Radiobacillus deserti]QDP39332.1 zf-HC2 domain-containing protein [Radiobacillus deserti]
MEHLNKERVLAYIADSLSEEEHETIEQHLYSCESCMNTYLENIEFSTPDYVISESFTDKTVASIESLYSMVPKNPTVNSNTKNKTFVHYIVAASLTLILFMSGVFQNALSITDGPKIEKDTPFTQKIMEQTSGFVDRWLEEGRK